MSGLIKIQNFWQVLKAFGVKAALKLIFSKDRTFLDFCMRNEIF